MIDRKQVIEDETKEKPGKERNVVYDMRNANVYGFAPEGKDSVIVAGEKVEKNRMISDRSSHISTGIEEILTQLKSAIDISEELDQKRRAKALKQVKALVEAAQNPTDKDLKESAEDAITMLEGIFSKLSDTSASEKFLSAIRQSLAQT